jgi:hypothetical protein
MESNGPTVIVGAALAVFAILLGRPSPEPDSGVQSIEIAAAEPMRARPSCRVDVLDDSGEPLDCSIATTHTAELAAQSAVADAPADLEDARSVEQLDADTTHASVVL